VCVWCGVVWCGVCVCGVVCVWFMCVCVVYVCGVCVCVVCVCGVVCLWCACGVCGVVRYVCVWCVVCGVVCVCGVCGVVCVVCVVWFGVVCVVCVCGVCVVCVWCFPSVLAYSFPSFPVPKSCLCRQSNLFPAVTQARFLLLFPFSLLPSVALFVLGSKLQMALQLRVCLQAEFIGVPEVTRSLSCVQKYFIFRQQPFARNSHSL